jgi:hypothetical protein
VTYGKFKLGLKPKRHDAKHLMLAKYLIAKELPTVPDRWDGYLGGKASPRMYCNDSLGDCGVAAIANHTRMQAAIDGVKLPEYTDDEIKNFYLTYTGGQDDGVVLSDFLDYVLVKGFPADGRVKFRARVSVDNTDWDAMRRAASMFGGLYVGIALPVRCQDEGDHWSVQGDGTTGQDAPGSWGGHAVYVSGFDNTASPAYDKPNQPVGNMSILTWGGVVFMTKHWFMTYCTEAYAIFDESHLSLPGIDGAALLADLEALRG